jgi:antitoxin component YwqK of YwqJK toxin-antitoxin module
MLFCAKTDSQMRKSVFWKVTLSTLSLLFYSVADAQQPKYTFTKFVTVLDTNEFKITHPRDGLNRTYIPAYPEIWDIDDDSTTYMRGGQSALLCIEGPCKNNKKEGVFTTFLIDSADHSRRYKIWEQNYSNDKLNGQWKTYTLHGTITNIQTFKDDSLNGVSRMFWIDGRSIMEENEFFNGRKKRLHREFYKNGKIKAEIPLDNDTISGTGKKYYEDGTIQEIAEFRAGAFDGTRKYYYPNGQLWIEQIYKNGKSWKVVANYTAKGQKREAGTLKDGNGTIIFYNEDGSVREVISYVNGEDVKAKSQ